MNEQVFEKSFIFEHLRPLEAQDFHKRYFELLAQLSQVEAMSEAEFLRIFHLRRERGVHTYVLEYEQQIIATISYLIEPKFYRGGRSVIHIEDVIVDRAYRHHKIGNLLLDFVKEKTYGLQNHSQKTQPEKIHPDKTPPDKTHPDKTHPDKTPEETPELGSYKLILDCKTSLKEFYELGGFEYNDIIQMSLYVQEEV